MLRVRFWIALAALGTAVCLVLVWLATSLFFLRALLPATGQYEVLIGSTNHAQLQPFLDSAYKLLAVSDEAQAVASSVQRWVYRKTDKEDIAAHTLGTDVPEQQWSRQALGVTSLYNSAGNQESFFTKQVLYDVSSYITNAVLGRLPFTQPSIIVDLPGAPGPFALAGQVQDNTLSFVYSRSGSLEALRGVKSSGVRSSGDTMNVALPSDFLLQLPENLQKNLEELLKTELGLTKSRPEIMSTLLQSTAFSVVEGEYTDEAAVGVVGASDAFVRQVRTWVALERGYLEPVQQAFLLPDRTVGYEYIPSPDSGDGFSEAGLDGCSISYIGPRPLWLCLSGSSDIAVISTAKELGYQSMDTLAELQSDNHWKVVLPDPYANQLVQAALQDTNAENIFVKQLYIEGDALRGSGSLSF